ncbi:hypothetical protein BSKO_00538 [Bryopsis sp. KO-2023]|nr:hypothetical protein BSKO_00538 [Bryopsis sp. KO-2023]
MSSTPTPPSGTTNDDGEETVESLKKKLERSEAARLKLREGLAAMREKALNTQKLVGKYKELTEQCHALQTTNRSLQEELSSTAGPSQSTQERERQLKTEYELQITFLQESVGRVEEKLKRSAMEVSLQVENVAKERKLREEAEHTLAIKEADILAKEQRLKEELEESMLSLETKAVLKERKVRQEVEQTLTLEIEILKSDAEKTKRMEKARYDNERELRELSERRLMKQTMDLQTTREEVVALKIELTNAIMVARNMQEKFHAVQQSVHSHWATMQDLIGVSGLSEIPISNRTKCSGLVETRTEGLPSSTHASFGTHMGDVGVVGRSNRQSMNGGVQIVRTSVSSEEHPEAQVTGGLGEKRKAVSNPEGQPPGTRSRVIPVGAPSTASRIVSNGNAPLISPVESPAQVLRIKFDRVRVLVQKLEADPPNFGEIANSIHATGGEELVSTVASELSRRLSQCAQENSGSPIVSTTDSKESWLVPWCKAGDKAHKMFAAIISLVGSLVRMDVFKGLAAALWKELTGKVLTYAKTSSGNIGDNCASAACAGHVCALLGDRQQLFTIFIVDLLSMAGRCTCSIMSLLLSLLGSWPQLLLLKGENDFLDRMIRSVIMALCATLMKPDGDGTSRHPLDVFAAKMLIQLGCEHGWWNALEPAKNGTVDPTSLIQNAGKGFMTEIGNVLRDFTSMFESLPSPNVESLWELMFHRCCDTLCLAIISLSAEVGAKLVVKRMFPWLELAGRERFPRVMEVFNLVLLTLLKLSPQPEVTLELAGRMLKVIDWQKQPHLKPNQLCLVTKLLDFLKEGQTLYTVSSRPDTFGKRFISLADDLDQESKALQREGAVTVVEIE